MRTTFVEWKAMDYFQGEKPCSSERLITYRQSPVQTIVSTVSDFSL